MDLMIMMMVCSCEFPYLGMTIICFCFIFLDDDNVLMGIENLAVFSDETLDPYVTKPDDEDSEEEDDFNLLPTDNLIAVGHVEGDAAILEIYGWFYLADSSKFSFY